MMDPTKAKQPVEPVFSGNTQPDSRNQPAAAPITQAGDEMHNPRNLPTPQALNAVERYNGQGDAHAWLDSFNTLAELYYWSDEVCLRVAKIRLSGPAQRWGSLRRFHDWDDFQEQFTRRFGETRESAVARLSRCFQKANESPKTFADRFLEDAERAGRVEDQALVFQFLRHLRPELRNEAARKRPQSIEQIVDFCNYWLGATADDNMLFSSFENAGAAMSPRRRVRFEEESDMGYKPRRNETPEPDTKWPENRNRYNDSIDRAGSGRNRFNERAPWTNRPFRPTNRDNFGRNPNPPPARSTAAAPAPSPDIDSLTQKFERLKLDQDNQLKEKDKEVRHLRYLLQQQQRQAAADSAAVNYMLPCDIDGTDPSYDSQEPGDELSDELSDTLESDPINELPAQPLPPANDGQNPAGDSYYMDPCSTEIWPEQEAIDPEYMSQLLGHMFSKRDAERLYERMPHKRQAIQVDGPSPYVPQARPPPPPPVTPPTAHNPEAAAATARMPRQRAAFNVPPYQGAPTSARPSPHTPAAQTPARATTAAAAAAGPSKDNAAANGMSTAARLANSMGQELATKMRENLKFEVCRDTAVVPQAILTCLAGHLASDTRLIEQGQNMARQVETVVHKLSPGKRSTTRANPTASTMHLAQPEPGPAFTAAAAADEARQLRHAGHKSATCTVWVKVNGRAVKAVVDTGACTSAITKDYLRRADLLDYLRADLATTYINADGRKSKGCGQAPGLVLTIGDEDTVICPTITAATSYDMLLGHDVLELLKAKVDVGAQTLTIQKAADDWLEIPLVMSHSRRPTTYLVQSLDSNYDPGNYTERAAAYYSHTDLPPGWDKKQQRRFIATWTCLADAIFYLPPQPPSVPGWKRCISADSQQADSLKYERWMDERTDHIDGWEKQLLHFVDVNDSQLLTTLHDRIQSMQELAAEHIKSGDHASNYPNFFDMSADDYSGDDDCSEVSTDDDDVCGAVLNYFLELDAAANTCNGLGDDDMPSLCDSSTDSSTDSSSECCSADDIDPACWSTDDPSSTYDPLIPELQPGWDATLSPNLRAAVLSCIHALQHPYEDMHPDVSKYLAFLDSTALTVSSAVDWPGAGATKEGTNASDNELPDIDEGNDCEDKLPTAGVHPSYWRGVAAVPDRHLYSADLDPAYSLDNREKQVIYFRGSEPQAQADQAYDAMAALPPFCREGPLHYEPEWHSGTDEDFIVLPMPKDAPGDPCSFPEDDALEHHGIEALFQLIDSDNSDLTPEQRKAAQDFLFTNADVFCLSPEQLGRCTVGCHVIDTGDAEPVKQTYYKMPFKKYEQMREHIDYLLSLGLIRESTSPWASPAHLVPKPKGEPGATRFVIDYRACNARSKKDAHPLPTVNSILYNMGQARYISCCDLMNGYWQLPLHPDSVATSAFVTPWGLYEWLVTPFGLTGAPASFQRIMQNLMRDFIGKFAFVYLDDFIAYSSTFEEHLEHLGKIFDKMRSAGLKINPKKCSLFKQQVTFLGFVVDQTGLHPDPRLLTAIENRKPPRNPKEVASFLGLTGYFRRFVEGYAKIAEPLTRLLRGTEPWVWDEEQSQAFEVLKQRLMSYPVLRRIDFSLPFKVYTDASTQAIGAILCQHDPDTAAEYVCAYHSKKLTPSEKIGASASSSAML